MSREIDTSLIIDIELDGIDTNDYPDMCDAYIKSASWRDTLKELTEDEINNLNENHREFVYQQVMDYLF